MFYKKYLFFLFCASPVFSCCTKNPNTGSTDPGSPTFQVTVTTVAGKVGDKGNAEDGQGGAARFYNPTKMVYDYRNGLLYIADGSVIRSMDAQYNVKTYVPLKALGSTSNDVLDMDLAPGNGGSLYLTTKENDLWKIEPNGDQGTAINIVNRINSGNETGPLNTVDHFDQAKGIATGTNGEIYFFNQSWNTMHRITLSSPTDGVVETFAGKPLTQSGGNGAPYPFQDGQGETATFSGRVGDIASDGNGNIYVADFDNNLVRKVTPNAQVTSLFPFKSHVGTDIDGPISKAQSNSVTQVTATRDGNFIFFASYGNAGNNLSSLRLVRPGKDVTTLVGYGYSSTYGDGTGKTAGLAEIGGIAATPDGKTIYVSEPGMKVIRKVVIQ